MFVHPLTMALVWTVIAGPSRHLNHEKKFVAAMAAAAASAAEVLQLGGCGKASLDIANAFDASLFDVFGRFWVFPNVFGRWIWVAPRGMQGKSNGESY